jgi:hypothetical protein
MIDEQSNLPTSLRLHRSLVSFGDDGQAIAWRVEGPWDDLVPYLEEQRAHNPRWLTAEHIVVPSGSHGRPDPTRCVGQFYCRLDVADDVESR